MAPTDGAAAHEEIKAEILRLRDRVHDLSSEVADCQVSRMEIDRMKDDLKKHEERDSAEHRKLAVVEVNVAHVSAALVAATAKIDKLPWKIGGFIAAIVSSVVLLIEFGFKLFGRG